MPNVAVTISGVIGGVTISGTITRSGATPLPLDYEAPVAKIGALSTRTDNDTGIATMAAGHGFITSDKLDVYWATGVRYGMTATVSGNAVTVDGGAGDNLPASTTALTVSKQITADIDFTPEIAELLLVGSQRKASIRFMADSVVALPVLLAAGEVYPWATDLGIDSPLGTDDITSILFSNGDSAGTNRIRLGVLLDSVV